MFFSAGLIIVCFAWDSAMAYKSRGLHLTETFFECFFAWQMLWWNVAILVVLPVYIHVCDVVYCYYLHVPKPSPPSTQISSKQSIAVESPSPLQGEIPPNSREYESPKAVRTLCVQRIYETNKQRQPPLRLQPHELMANLAFSIVRRPPKSIMVE